MKQIPDYVINERKREACEFLSDKNSTPSQRALARRFMNAPITSLEALKLYGCLRLAGRIYDLKQKGHDIFTVRKELPNGKRIGEYYLISSEGKNYVRK